MLRNHSFRKANISIGFAFLAMVVCAIVVGGDPSESESQLVAAIAFGTMLVTLFAQHDRENRRRQSPGYTSGDDQAD